MSHAQLANSQATLEPGKKGGGKDLFRTQFMKTQLCQFYLQGRCRHGDKGEKCAFSHGSVEIPPDLTKTSLCKNFKAGKCCLSTAKCAFAHSERELRVTPLFVQKRHVQDAKLVGLISDVSNPPPVSNVPMPSFKGASSTDFAAAIHAAPSAMPLASRPWWQDLNLTAGDFIQPAGIASRRQACFAKSGSLLPFPPAHNAPSALDLLQPMKVKSEFFVGVEDIDPFEPVKVTPNRWDHWEDDTAIGETSSDDDGSHSSLAVAGPEPFTPMPRQDFQGAGFRANEGVDTRAEYASVSGMPWW